MIVKQLITDGILPLKTSDTGRTALSWMEDFRVTHLPIVNESSFLGLISEFDVYNMNDFDEPIGSYSLSLSKPYVYDYQHLFDALRQVYVNKLSLIPVLDEHDNYLGAITLQSLLEHFAASFSVAEPGGVIVLEMSENDYSLSEIARIVESNDAKILSLYTTLDPNSTRLDVSLKINRIELGGILQTFNRLMNYLNI